MRSPIFLVMFGRLTKLQSFIVKKAKNLYSRAANRFARTRNEDSGNRSGQHNNNNIEMNVNVNQNMNDLQNNNENNRNYRYDRPQLQIV